MSRASEQKIEGHRFETSRWPDIECKRCGVNKSHSDQGLYNDYYSLKNSNRDQVHVCWVCVREVVLAVLPLVYGNYSAVDFPGCSDCG